MEQVKDILSDPWSLAREIFDLSETGSSEFKSSALICDIMEKHGFTVGRNYRNMPTAFRAEKIKGKGSHRIAFLAEYDALMGIGHACGHNLIAAANVFAAIRTAEKADDGIIVLIGTPDEEGTGEYAGSKAIFANDGVFSDVELVLGAHPGSGWGIAENALAVQDLEITFRGYSSHEAASPEKGKSALDAAVLTYTAINMFRQHLRRDASALIHGVIREGGEASNVTPDRAVMV
jgi:Metal-dependent amidase/aminoacylase/carboxypeptidase